MPFAVPDGPVLVAQVTDVTPALSVAVPLKRMLDEVVETEVAPGLAMTKDGGVVSLEPPEVEETVLVTVTTCEM